VTTDKPSLTPTGWICTWNSVTSKTHLINLEVTQSCTCSWTLAEPKPVIHMYSYKRDGVALMWWKENLAQPLQSSVQEHMVSRV
jgi:hypothetical protein